MDHDDGHRYFEGLAVAHVLGGLDDSEGRVFRAHLLECGSCRARVGELRAIAHDLADVERDERRVRAAQAIDTKRREADDEGEEPVEALPSARSSRITVVVGLVMILGLSLWNFTLRSTQEVLKAENAQLRKGSSLVNIGTPWEITRRLPDVEASLKSDDTSFVLTIDGLEAGQYYGVYAKTSAGDVSQDFDAAAPDGRIHGIFDLPDDATTVIVTNPNDAPGRIAEAGPEPSGQVILEAARPTN